MDDMPCGGGWRFHLGPLGLDERKHQGVMVQAGGSVAVLVRILHWYPIVAGNSAIVLGGAAPQSADR